MGNEFTKLFELIISASLINNFVFTRFLGLCIFFGVSEDGDCSGNEHYLYFSYDDKRGSQLGYLHQSSGSARDYVSGDHCVHRNYSGLVQASDTIMKRYRRGFITSWVSILPLYQQTVSYLRFH